MSRKKDTKTKILDAAEALFSRDGIAKTSLRTIIAKANVNIAAIHYHFGSKKEVISAVYLRRLQPINEKRLAKLQEMKEQAGEEKLDLEEIIKAFLLPILICESVSKNEREKMRKLFSHVQTEPDEVAHIMDMFKDVFEQYTMAIAEVLPQLSKDDLTLRFMFMIGVMGSIMNKNIFHNKLSKIDEKTPFEVFLNKAIKFVAAGFKA
ncbi:MAG: TetR/AcrR family transcriptional regulator [Calditrichaeota bacterium]|nr:MAG: TetR/AcrR family transcriptional regulator [Calditrichota bacterium]MBL1206169.1 TetR/AcrR family transcriptional regulator [Calditrichota bacterium]NOG45994.1 TetR/AcrR family transcriptional regulator [Calditrichota bacterium]